MIIVLVAIEKRFFIGKRGNATPSMEERDDIDIFPR